MLLAMTLIARFWAPPLFSWELEWMLIPLERARSCLDCRVALCAEGCLPRSYETMS